MIPEQKFLRSCKFFFEEGGWEQWIGNKTRKKSWFIEFYSLSIYFLISVRCDVQLSQKNKDSSLLKRKKRRKFKNPRNYQEHVLYFLLIDFSFIIIYYIAIEGRGWKWDLPHSRSKKYLKFLKSLYWR